MNPGPGASSGNQGTTGLSASLESAFAYDIQPSDGFFKDSLDAPALNPATDLPTHPLGSLNGQLTIGDVSDAGLTVTGLTPQNATVPVTVNSRAELCYAPRGIRRGTTVLSTDSTESNYWANYVTLEWRYAPSASQAAEGTSLRIPDGMGFSGVSSPLLTTGPLTAGMDGWLFRLEVHDRSNTDLSAVTSWVLLDIDGVQPDAAPVAEIISRPAAANGLTAAADGTQVVFTAAAQSSIPGTNLSFQWQALASQSAEVPEPEWTDLSGATDATYIVRSSAALSGTQFRCLITNSAHQGGEPAVSNALTLECTAPNGSVQITGPEAASLTSIYAGRTFSANVLAAADNGAPLTYQWFEQVLLGALPAEPVMTAGQAAALTADCERSAIAGQTSAALATPALTEGVYVYTCDVRNAQDPAQSLVSDPIYVVVTERSRIPAISVPAYSPVTSVGVEAGEPLSLPCTAYVASGETLTYNWEWADAPDGPWNSDPCTESALEITDTPSTLSGRYYRCTVTNVAAHQSSVSPLYRVNVWTEGDIPELTIVPESQELIWNAGIEGGSIVLRAEASIAESADFGSLVPEWKAPNGEIYTAAANPETDAAAGRPAVSVSDSTENGMVTFASTLTVPVADEWTAQQFAGVYSLTWFNSRESAEAAGLDVETNLQVPADTDLLVAPQSTADGIAVSILISGTPEIESESPALITESVGNTATFWVSALLHEALGAEGSLVYTWQMTDDGGDTWRNCLSTDGIGQYTDSFTTEPLTMAMYDHATASNVAGEGTGGAPGNANTVYMYRCIAANRTTGTKVQSSTFKLLIQPSGQLITPGAGSTMTITSVDGVRYLIGPWAKLTARSMQEILARLNYVPPQGYTLEIRTADGQPAAADARAETGTQLILIDNAGGETVDRVILVIRGDVLGAGIMNIAELHAMAQGLNGERTLEGAYALACDMNSVTGIDIGDIVAGAQILNRTVQPE
ncbi:MAG: hypothetical protein HDQ87_04910 [Clostridia bacterium]|nr:hypothetical protein [Clostridia bacterium]